MRTDAIYQNGVFRPLTPVVFKENQRVSLEVESLDQEDTKDADRWREWLERASKHREELKSKYGIMPDSAVDIAEDRKR